MNDSTKPYLFVSLAPFGGAGGVNPGMVTVDYAAINVLKESGQLEKSKFCRLWAPRKHDDVVNPEPIELAGDLDGRFQYGELEPGGNLDAKAVLYWGDFQHGKLYSELAAEQLIKSQVNYGNNQDSILTAKLKVVQYFQLEKKDENSNVRYASYGTTLFQNSALDYTENDYSGRITRFVNGAEFLRFRDSYSANVASQLTNDYITSFRGTDCALLNTKQELDELIANNSNLKEISNGVGWFIGRSTKSFPRLSLVKFINEFSLKLDSESVELQWAALGNRSFGKSLGPFKHFLKRNTRDLYSINCVSDLLHIIREQKIIITDTYHVAVNSWALGVPAILIYEPSPHVDSNCNMGHLQAFRDKRVLFGLTEQLEMFLISAPLLRRKNYRKQKVILINEMINHPQKFNSILTGLRQRAVADRKMIIEWLKSL